MSKKTKEETYSNKKFKVERLCGHFKTYTTPEEVRPKALSNVQCQQRLLQCLILHIKLKSVGHPSGKMVLYEEVNVHGYAEFCQAVSDRKGKEIFAYFSGNKDDKGKSWCPDCVKAEPIVRGEMSHLPEGSVFIYCQVGERAYWKDPNNEFKKTLKLSGVPTLLRYGTPQKLVEEECFKPELVKMMFTED